MLREIPPGAEEEAEEAVRNCCTEVNTTVQRSEGEEMDEVAMKVTFPELKINRVFLYNWVISRA